MATRTQSAPSNSPRRRTRKTAPVDRDRQAVAQRAYELFLARGGSHGDDVNDWLAAERELSPPADADVPS